MIRRYHPTYSTDHQLLTSCQVTWLDKATQMAPLPFQRLNSGRGHQNLGPGIRGLRSPGQLPAQRTKLLFLIMALEVALRGVFDYAEFDGCGHITQKIIVSVNKPISDFLVEGVCNRE
uniref:Uncharacterized protein n=1 Tax=Romanomermis culicivorax TaxID=13658 RepID=A0A915K3P9_ROMCU